MDRLRGSPRRLSAGLLLLVASLPATAASAQAQRPGEPTSDKSAPVDNAKPRPASPPDAKQAAPQTSGTAATVVSMKTIEGVMGKAVRSRDANEDMGHIVDVLVDGAGQIRAAVIDFGGFLGVGNRKVAVAWKTLDFADSIASGKVKVSLTRDQVRQAPEYKSDEPVVVLEDAGSQSKDAAQKPAAVPSPAGHNETAPAR